MFLSFRKVKLVWAGCLLLAALPLAAAAQPLPLGWEFQVNQTSLDSGNFDDDAYGAAPLSGGGFAVSYNAQRPGGGITNVQHAYVRTFNDDGGARSNEAELGPSVGFNFHPQVSGMSDGGAVVVWEPTYDYIYGQRFDAAGVATSGQIEVNHEDDYQYTMTAYTRAAGLTGGGFVANWCEMHTQSGNEWEVYARVFGDNNAGGSKIHVNQLSQNYQDHTRVAALADGGFVVMWMSADVRYAYEAIYVRAYHPDGSPRGDAVRVRESTEDFDWRCADPELVGLPGGGFLVTYDRDRLARGVMYDNNANLVRNETVVSDPDSWSIVTYPHPAALPDGQVVVVWRESGYGSSQEIKGQLLDPNLTPIGAAFLVNHNSYKWALVPKVTATGAGNFCVIWSAMNDGDEDPRLLGRMYQP